MPIGGTRVVVVTPAGRRRYLAVLLPYVRRLRARGLVDEYRLWANTANPSDIEYMEAVAAADEDFVRLERLPEGAAWAGNESIHHFFRNCTDAETVYVRLDDDVVMLDDASAFEAFVRFRIDNPEPFLVYANILNNAVIAHIHKQAGTLALPDFDLEYHCTESPAWKDPACAEALHAEVLHAADAAGGLAPFRLPFDPVFANYERVSINVIAWRGEEFAAFGGEVGTDEELWLSTVKNRELRRPNRMFGGFVCVHFAFYTQRGRLETRDFLRRYATLAGLGSDEWPPADSPPGSPLPGHAAPRVSCRGNSRISRFS